MAFLDETDYNCDRAIVIDVRMIEQILKRRGFDVRGLSGAISGYLVKSFGIPIWFESTAPSISPTIPYEIIDSLFEASGLSEELSKTTYDVNSTVSLEIDNGFLILRL